MSMYIENEDLQLCLCMTEEMKYIYMFASSSLHFSDLCILVVFRDEVLKAFKQLAFQLHPDKNSAPGSEDAFKMISRAKDDLLS